ncbi:MAG: hypothetical protein AAF939_01115 [Planctomycetota bacterium]
MTSANRNLILVLLLTNFLYVDFALAQPPNPSTQKQDVTLAELSRQAIRSFSEGEYDSALEKAKTLTSRQPTNLRFQFFYGSVAFAAGEVKQSAAAFDQVVQLDPTIEPSLWQRGLAYYYADRFKDGVAQFETHQTVNTQDVENAVWHLLCASKISDLQQARKQLIPISEDGRVPMTEIYEMFAGRKTPADVHEAAKQTSVYVKPDSERHRLQRYYAHLYIGLYQEMMGESELAKASLEKAVLVNPLPKDNFMGAVAQTHLTVRWAEPKATDE